MYSTDTEGLDAVLEEEAKETKVTTLEEAKKKRRPFHYWTVDGVEHRMKLTADMVTMLESKYRMNILVLVTADNLPPLSTMLTIAQAAINPWEHGTKFETVKAMYDKWVEEGGNQIDFLSKIIIPTLGVSGFFTEQQVEMILKNIEQSSMML